MQRTEALQIAAVFGTLGKARCDDPPNLLERPEAVPESRSCLYVRSHGIQDARRGVARWWLVGTCNGELRIGLGVSGSMLAVRLIQQICDMRPPSGKQQQGTKMRCHCHCHVHLSLIHI